MMAGASQPAGVFVTQPEEFQSPFPNQSYYAFKAAIFPTPGNALRNFAISSPLIARRVVQPTADDEEGWFNQGVTPTTIGGDTDTNTVYPHGVTWWNNNPIVSKLLNPQRNIQRFYFSGFSQDGRIGVDPDLSELDSFEGDFVNSPTHSNTLSAAYVTGETLYDPFPYGEECPLYFWCDLEDCNYIYFFIEAPFTGGQATSATGGPGPQGVQPMWGVGSDISSTGTTPYSSNLADPANFVYFELKCSDDGGDTWRNPFFASGSDGGNPDNPSPSINRYPETQAKWVNPPSSGINTLTQPLGRIVGPSGAQNGSGQVLPRFDIWQENMLFKIVLHTPGEDVWLKFGAVGVEYGSLFSNRALREGL